MTIMGSRSRSLSLTHPLSPFLRLRARTRTFVTATIMSLSRAAAKSKKKYIAPKGIRTLNLLIAKYHIVGLLPVFLKGNRFRPVSGRIQMARWPGVTARPSLSQELQSQPASAAATASRAGRVTGNGHGKRGPDHWQVRV